MFVKSNEIQIIQNDPIAFEKTYQILKQYKSLSFTDANIVYFSRKKKIKEIYSYDDGFDNIKNITRIY